MDKREYYLEKLGKLRQKHILEKKDFDLIVESIKDWFEFFQWDEDVDKMIELYEKLVEEEKSEVCQAWYEKDIYKLIDAYIDLLWVLIWVNYFLNKKTKKFEDPIIFIKKYVSQYRSTVVLPEQLLTRWLLEVSYSNWTKSSKKKMRGRSRMKSWKNY
jgi:hypothetical protein